MAKNKHLTRDDRTIIFDMLNESLSFKAIGIKLEKSASSISREVRSHFIFKQTGYIGRSYNPCIHRFSCDHRLLCSRCPSGKKYHFCRFCNVCIHNCPDFKQEFCKRHCSPPYVCNGCSELKRCSLEKHLYHATTADSEYKAVLSECRSGISLNEEEVKHLDSIVSPLIRKGQSLNHICANHTDSIMISESTLYRLVDYNLFSARNIDLPRKVRYKPRKVKKSFKVDKSCRIGRTYEDFTAYMAAHPDTPIVQMDSVEGRKGGKVLLTLHFVKAELMLAFLRDSNDSQSVIDIMDKLFLELRPDIFMKLFPLILTDNGSEFSNPKAIQYDRQGNRRTLVFYCDPGAAYQKGSAEKNHEFIRMVIPKGTSMDDLTQEEVNCMMNHINSYSRESLGNKCPYDMFSFLHGEGTLSLLGCMKIPADEVTLNASVFNLITRTSKDS